ncbi:MAG TPA: hypothetical protein VKX96_04825, partial [Chloroflexota bacterium]|nr:hypothetical protein [Chloroflexota bacterium]
MLVLVGLYDELLPRLDGSADPAFVRTGPWAFDLPLPAFVTNSGGAPIFLSLVLLSAIATAYVVGLGVIHRLPGDRRTLLIVLGFSVLASVIMLVSPPSRNADLDYYAFEGRMIIRDGQNPYAVPARALADDAWFPVLSPTWRALTTGYGPAWLAIASGVDVVTDHGGGLSDLARTLTGFRLLFVVLGSFNALFIWSILGIIAPERRLTGTIAYVWNPVVLLIGVEHNDTAMLFLALLGIWLEVHGRPALAIVALTLSALLKYLTGPLLIAYLVWRWRSAGRRRTLVLAILAAVTTGLVFLPFDPIVFLSHLPTYLHQSGRLDHIEQASFLLVAMVVIGSLIALSWPRQLNQVFSVATLVLFAYLAELSRDWFPWYVVSVLGISTLPGGWWLGAAATSGVTWILGLHQGTAYLAGLAQSSL